MDRLMSWIIADNDEEELDQDLSVLGDRFVGSALGTFVGDAMGRQVEGWSREMIRLCAGIVEDVGDGMHTDDTEMMIGIMESLVENPQFDPALTAQKFMENFHGFRGYGARIYRIVDRLRQGHSWDQVGTDSWGNGGAMRIAPVGFFYYNDTEKLSHTALVSAQITHRHQEGMAGALAQALAVGLATEHGVTRKRINGRTFLREIVSRVRSVDGVVAQELNRIESLDSTGGVEDKIEQIAATYSCDISAKGAVPPAVAAFLLNVDFADTVVTAVNCGGDTDTMGAMAGAIAGAYYGFWAIPRQWVMALENGTKGRDYVIALAKELAELKAREVG